MDFMKLLKSIEELLYELISWFVFYPLTFWRIVLHPIAMLSYAQKELTEKDEDQFDDAVSPPILLVLTLVILHVVEGALNQAWAAALPELFQDDRNLLIFRAVSFSLFPLLFATVGLRAGGARLTRKLLKPAFYSQSYATVPFVLAVSFGMQLIGRGGSPALQLSGTGLMIAGATWYLGVQTKWLTKTIKVSPARALAAALGLFLTALFMLLIVVVGVGLTTHKLVLLGTEAG
jgi:hypothetical protein